MIIAHILEAKVLERVDVVESPCAFEVGGPVPGVVVNTKVRIDIWSCREIRTIRIAEMRLSGKDERTWRKYRSHDSMISKMVASAKVKMRQSRQSSSGM